MVMIGGALKATFLAFGLAGLCAAAAHADQFKLHYTMAIDGADAAHGQLVCETGVRCEVKNGDMRFSLTAPSDPSKPHVVRVDCGSTPCSFRTELPSLEFQKETMPLGFHIYYGEDRDVFRQLVYRPRREIGWLMLTY